MPSSKTRKKKNHRNVSSAQGWKKRTKGVRLELPSGEVAICQRVGLSAFLETGAIPDFLSPIVEEVIRTKEHLPPTKQAELAKDPKAILKGAEMLDRCLVMSVIEPRVTMPPGCAYVYEGDDPHVCGKFITWDADDRHDHDSENFNHEFVVPMRDEDLLYADDVDLEDKVFVFQWSVGGGADLTTFRAQYERNVEAVASL